MPVAAAGAGMLGGMGMGIAQAAGAFDPKSADIRKGFYERMELIPDQYKMANRWDPKFQELDMRLKGDLVTGTSEYKGMPELMRMAKESYAPEAADIENELLNYYLKSLKSAGGMTAAERANSLRTIRSGQAARGLGFGAADLAGEAVALDRASANRTADLSGRAANMAAMTLGNMPNLTPQRSATQVPGVDAPYISQDADRNYMSDMARWQNRMEGMKSAVSFGSKGIGMLGGG
jgi:hypothetical protein